MLDTESSPFPKLESPMPDIKDTDKLSGWMRTNIIRPPKGYNDLKHKDGSHLSEKEQIEVYIGQTIDVIEFCKQQNRPASDYEQVKEAVLELTQPPKPILIHK